MPDLSRHSFLIASGILLLCIGAFMFSGVQGAWSFVLPFRAQKLLSLILVATAISVSTVLFATVTNNRILTPALMGFDSLYVLIQTALAFTLGVAGSSVLSTSVLYVVQVVIMVFLATALFQVLFLGSSRSLHLVLLVGMVMGTLFRSLSIFLQRLLSPTDFVVLQDQLFASFNSVPRGLLGVSTVLTLLVLVVVWNQRFRYDILALGRDQSINLGLEYRKEVLQVMICVSILVSVSTALVGPVTFFGLLVANLAYHLAASYRHSHVLPLAVLVGAITLIGGQTVLERLLGYDTALSIVVEFLGGIVFIGLLLREKRL